MYTFRSKLYNRRSRVKKETSIQFQTPLISCNAATIRLLNLLIETKEQVTQRHCHSLEIYDCALMKMQQDSKNKLIEMKNMDFVR